MAVDYMAPGRISPIPFYRNQKGYVMMLPTHEDTQRVRKYMGKLGFELCVADTFKQAQDLQKKLQKQLYEEQQVELSKDDIMTMQRRKQVRDRLVARMNSASCNQYERDFIALWLQAREEKHRIFQEKFTSQIGHLDALEFDNPTNHTADLLDRI